MKPKQSFWQRIGLHDFFVKSHAETDEAASPVLTSDNVYQYILQKFKESVTELSFAGRVVFYHEYIICFNPDDYTAFMDNRKGIFGLIVHESVKKFYELLKEYRALGKTVEPSAGRWVFRFVANPDYPRGDLSFIGKLLPDSAATNQKEENLRVTYIPRQTGIAQTFDINPDILKEFHFYSDGYYEVPFREDFRYDERQMTSTPGSAATTATPVSRGAGGFSSGGNDASKSNAFARLEAIIPDKEYAGKKIEYLVQADDVVVSGKEANEGGNVFRVPSDWVNTPHLRIRYSAVDTKLSVASFGEKTVVNEKEVPRSEEGDPQWTELPFNSRILLNGIVGINVFKW